MSRSAIPAPATILLTDYAWPDLNIENRLASQAGYELLVAPAADEATLCRLAANVSAIVTCWAKISAAVIEAAGQCQTVARLGIGLDNIDVAACTRRRIPVTNVPSYCVDEVAEHALALLFALARNIGYFHQQTKDGRYNLSDAPLMHRIAGQTLGIVGLGRIGRALTRRAIGVGMRVLAWSRSEYIGDLAVDQVPFDRLLGESDFVSIHTPLTDQTHNLFDRSAFARMKRTAFLINTARGKIVNSAALWEALRNGEIAGAGLDVQDPEPPDLEHPLYKDERVIVTPHAAFTSIESVLTLRRTAFRQAIDVLAGRRPDNVVNPEVYGPLATT